MITVPLHRSFVQHICYYYYYYYYYYYFFLYLNIYIYYLSLHVHKSLYLEVFIYNIKVSHPLILKFASVFSHFQTTCTAMCAVLMVHV